ncbi:sel1 repeat family protein [Frateuria aurantia]
MAVLCCVTAGAAFATSGSDQRQATRNELYSITHTDTWGHPDQFGQLSGMLAFSDGHYRDAMSQFRFGALYADKVSQLSIGLMYLNGQGVAKNPVMAYAWIALASERNYPQFVATRDHLGQQLTPAQLRQAEQIESTLARTYGDAVAQPRMARALHVNMQYLNPVGRASGAVYSYTDEGNAAPGNCGIRDASTGAVPDCSMYAKWRFDPRQYFAARDSVWNPSRLRPGVIVQPIQSIGPAAPETPRSGKPG